MKTRYIIVMVVLIILSIGFELSLFFSPLGRHPILANAIQAAGIFVALVAAVVALSATDRKKGKIQVEIEQTFDEKRDHYKKDMSETLKKHYKDFPDPVISAQVHFKMTNMSGFDLIKPTLTLSLPWIKQHPHRRENEHTWSVLSFNWNLNTSRNEFSALQFGDTLMLSNSTLPYWNNKIW